MKKLLVALLSIALLASAADFEYNSGGAMGTVPTTGGSSTGWGEWFIVPILNNSGQEITLTELGFPCGGPATGAYGWVVWTDVGGLTPPAGEASTADNFGAFTPVDPDPSTSPPVNYSYIDVTAENIVIADGAYFCVGYDVTGIGGQVDFNGTDTYSWYEGAWDSDQAWGRTDIIEVSASFVQALDQHTWGAIKASCF